MTKQIRVQVPDHQGSRLIDGIGEMSGILNAKIFRTVSNQPEDIVEITFLDRDESDLMLRLSELRSSIDISSITVMQPTAVISEAHEQRIADDVSQAGWEEMEFEIAKESNASWSTLWLMFLSGVIAAAGLATNALHLVIGAMVIAPGFLPFLRIGLGAVAGRPTLMRGIVSTAKAYALMVLGAAAAASAFYLAGSVPIGVSSTYLGSFDLLSYWTNITWTSVTVSAAAAFCGAVLVMARKAILSAGVMIALALVPSATIIGIALVSLDLSLLVSALVRWLIDAVLIVAAAFVLYGWTKRRSIKRDMWA